MKVLFRFHLIRMIACSILLLALILPCCDKNPSGGDDDTLTDMDGNEYQIVKIGEQWWMSENLKVTRYRNGDAIPHITDDTEWSGLNSSAYCVFNNNANNTEVYGCLYNGHAVIDIRGLAPDGWHVPTDEEWKTLEQFLGMDPADADERGCRGIDEGGKLKEAGTGHWNTPNTGATNSSGFTALPAGHRYHYTGLCESLGFQAYFCSSTLSEGDELYGRKLDFDASCAGRSDYNKRDGVSVRCVKDR